MEEKEIKQEIKSEEISDDIVNLVVARLEAMPPTMSISIGDPTGSEYTLKEMIESVKKKDDIGKKMIEMQVLYIKSLRDTATV